MKKQLTSKQEAFCRAFVSGGKDGQGMSLSDAYRLCYDLDPATKSNTVNSLASKLYRKGYIRASIDSLLEAKRRGAVASALSRSQRVLDWLEGVYQGTEDADAVRVRAAELTGKASGLFTTDITVTQSKDSSGLASEIEALLLTANESTEAEPETPEQLH